MALHCPDCGFVNNEGANYCQKCGAFVGDPGHARDPAYRVDDATGEFVPVDLDAVVASTGAAIVIRAGGGRVGESVAVTGERLTIGRRPDAGLFLDDVTVSRDHARVLSRGGSYWLEDLGSLNGTYVNRRRIDSHRLSDGDEVQIGKYKLTFLSG